MTVRVLLGPDELRLMVRNMGDCREDFNDRYNVDQLIAIYRAHLRCEWDIYPDRWTDAQVEGALSGVVPRFDDNGAPL